MAQLSAAMFGLGSAITAAVPGRVRYGAARLAGEVGFAIQPRLRRQAIENYAAVLGLPESAPEARRVAREAVVGYTKLMADFLLLPRLRSADILERVRVRGLENIRTVLEAGHGAIAVTPHFGNWDMAAAAAVASGLTVTAVTDRFGDGQMNEKVVASRQRFGMKVVPVGVSAGKAVLTALRRNEVVALVCDLPKEGRNILVDLAGQSALVPAGPALLSLRAGAPVVPIVCRRMPDNRYDLEIQAPVEFTPSGDSERDVPRLAQAIMDRFDALLRSTPEQWYLFSPMWTRGTAGQAPLGAVSTA
jgi:lauroyl/myristoyl acyltransferase